jgi:hypothetical protein
MEWWSGGTGCGLQDAGFRMGPSGGLEFEIVLIFAWKISNLDLLGFTWIAGVLTWI